ncbi:hypothetical protein ACWCSD_34500 [Nonomuraea sp. NPDC001684]
MYANWYARLHEANTWTDEHGTTHIIARMSPRYARNLLVWLDRQHEGIVRAAAMALCDIKMPPFHTQAYDEVVSAGDAEAEAMRRNPRAWLADTPLVQALAAAASPYIARHRQPKRHLRTVPLTPDRHVHSI